MTTWWRAPHMLSTNCNSCTWNPQEMEGTWLILALELAIKCQSYTYIYICIRIIWIYTYIYIYIYTYIYIRILFAIQFGSLQALARKENAICCWLRELEAHGLYKDLGVSQKKWETHGNFSWGILGSNVWLPKCGIQHIWRVYSNFLIFFGYTHLVCSELRKDRDKKCSPPGRRIGSGLEGFTHQLIEID